MSRSRFTPPDRRSHVADWERTQKPRVWKGQFRLLIIVLLSLTTWTALPATLYYTGKLFLDPTPQAKVLAAGWMAAFVLSLLVGVVLSASTKCSLCHSTPFLEKRCRKHQLANRIPLLTYRASAVVNLMFRGHFRCMYCSTPYRIGFKTKDPQA